MKVRILKVSTEQALINSIESRHSMGTDGRHRNSAVKGSRDSLSTIVH